MVPRFAALIGNYADSPKTQIPRRLLVLRDALVAICDGRWNDAEKALTIDGATEPCDAVFLNLLGIVCQGRHEWKQAKRFFGRAMRAKDGCLPAEQNLRRLYELETFGKTDLALVLLDDSTDMELRSRFGVPRMRQ
jgi:uncharacterized protein HemY